MSTSGKCRWCLATRQATGRKALGNGWGRHCRRGERVNGVRPPQAPSARALLGASFAGILLSDRYSAYAWVEAQRRQLCWANLFWDFTKILERSGKAGQIGEELITLSNRMFRFWHTVRDARLRREGFACHMLFLQARIEATLRQGSQYGESRTANTCRNVLKMKSALWTFVQTSGVSTTNILAERSLRHDVIWCKISFGTQSEHGSRYVEPMIT